MSPRAHKACLSALRSTILRAAAGPARMQLADAGEAEMPTKTAAPVCRADAAAGGGLPGGRRPEGPRTTTRCQMPNGRTGRRVRRAGRRQSPLLNQFVGGLDTLALQMRLRIERIWNTMDRVQKPPGTSAGRTAGSDR